MDERGPPLLYQQPYGAFQRAEQVKYVNGPESARAYAMSPCSSAVLMDSAMDRFYFKETDAAGMATVRAFDFTEVREEREAFVTRDEMEAYVRELVDKAQPPAKPARGGGRGKEASG